MFGRALRRGIAKTIVAITAWKPSIESWPAKSIIIGAPHTSNLDAVMMVLIMWLEGRSFNFLVKDDVMKYPVLKQLVRGLGGIPVNRSQAAGITTGVSQTAQSATTFTLCITPKGTRSKRDFWKSGFYRMAYENKLPITFGFVDSKTKTFGTGPTIQPSWNIKEDMDTIRAFYADMKGFQPDKSSVPRLRGEEDADAAAYLLRPVNDDPVF